MSEAENLKGRHRLPNRRMSETLKLPVASGHSIHLTIGYDMDDTSRPLEVFYSDGFRSGSALEFVVQDACVLLSLLLQHGMRPDDIAKSLARVEQPGGEMAYGSVIGEIVSQLQKEKLHEREASVT